MRISPQIARYCGLQGGRNVWATGRAWSAIFLFCACAVAAQDRPGRLERLGSSTAGSERITPPPADDTVFLADTGPSLDTGCTYHSGGPLYIHLPVGRYVGDVDKLLSQGLLSPKAHLFLPAFDVDVHGAPGYPPEVDKVYFNGDYIGDLTGDNNIWKLNDFAFDIHKLNFPARGAPGSAIVPADNVIKIDIDTASQGEDNWCTAVDWVELQFDAIAPIFLVHGTNADSSTWTPDFTSELDDLGVPRSNDINLTPNGAILANGHMLSDQLTALAAEFGAKKCHIIAHSKGGLDTRAYLNHEYHPKKLKVLSVHALSTPHHGTIVADIFVASRDESIPGSADPDLKYLIDHDLSFLAYEWLPLCVQVPHGMALADQTTTNMAAFNQTESDLPDGLLFYSYGADADVDHSGTITLDETSKFFEKCGVDLISDDTKVEVAAMLYRTIANVASITVTSLPGQPWNHPDGFSDIELDTVTTSFAVNDFVVSAASAEWPDSSHYLGTVLANHTTIKSAAVAEAIVNHIHELFPNR